MTVKSFPSRLRGAVLLLATAAALSACGGSDDDRPDQAVTPPPVSTPPPESTTDSFFALVLARVSSLLDNAEPVNIDLITPTTPGTTEPEPIPSN